MLVTITKEHFASATEYIDINNCPLAIAAKELFPGKLVSVGSSTLTLNHKRHLINWFINEEEISEEILSNDGIADQMNLFISDAKQGKEVGLVQVEIPSL